MSQKIPFEERPQVVTIELIQFIDEFINYNRRVTLDEIS